MRVFSLLLAILMFIFSGLGIIKETKESGGKEDDPQVINDISGDGAIAGSVLYAAKERNGIQGYYSDSDKSAYTLQNENGTLTHTLTKTLSGATLRNSDGNMYFRGTIRGFYEDKHGVKHYSDNSATDVYANTTKLGIYYYETHIRGFDFRMTAIEKERFYLDKTFHAYPDRLFCEMTLYAAEATADLGAFGTEILIPSQSIDKIEIKDKNGFHSKPAEADPGSTEYAAFDIRNAGTVAFIVPANSGTSSLAVYNTGLYYRVTMYSDYIPGTAILKYDETGDGELKNVTHGFRIYNDEAHSFEGVRVAADEERNPLENVTVSAANSNAEYLGYDGKTGAYTISMDGIGFNYAYYNEPELQLAAPITFNGADADRKLYVRSIGNNGCLEAAALLDENGTLAAEDVEVCKNFRGDFGEPVKWYTYIDYEYGESYFPLEVKANQTTAVTLLNLYQNWGQYPLKQISSIEFGNPYYHLSTGVTESNCIAPYFLENGWSLPDFRGASGELWPTQPQHNSVGILAFARYRTTLMGSGSADMLRTATNTGAKIDSTGQCYSDITNYYKDDSGSYSYSVRHVEFPQTDENRTFIDVDITFDSDTAFNDFRRDFDLFYFDGRFVTYNSFGYLNSQNNSAHSQIKTDGKDRYFTLGSDCPYYSFYDVTEETEHNIDECFGSSFGLIVRDYSVTADGETADIPLTLKLNATEGCTSGTLTLNKKSCAFKAGDTIHLELILLPWGTGREKNDDNVLAVRNDSAINSIAVTEIETGKIIDDSILPTVYADGNKAEFTLTGGSNNVAVRIDGFTSPICPEITVNGEKAALPSSNGYDGYTIHYNPDGTYGFSFIVNTDGSEKTVSAIQ